jgi:hypothetical protein
VRGIQWVLDNCSAVCLCTIQYFIIHLQQEKVMKLHFIKYWWQTYWKARFTFQKKKGASRPFEAYIFRFWHSPFLVL